MGWFWIRGGDRLGRPLLWDQRVACLVLFVGWGLGGLNGWGRLMRVELNNRRCLLIAGCLSVVTHMKKIPLLALRWAYRLDFISNGNVSRGDLGVFVDFNAGDTHRSFPESAL